MSTEPAVDFAPDEPGDPDSAPELAVMKLPDGYVDGNDHAAHASAISPDEHESLVQRLLLTGSTHGQQTVGVSGLSTAHRAHARKVILEGAHLLMRNPAGVHYSQGPQRWQGIDRKLRIEKGQCITQGDCSSTAEWLLWNALYLPYGVRDLVSHESWRAGYTGTMVQGGKRVKHDYSLKIGDCIFYGPAPTYEHVAISLGGRKILSHGGEAGPFVLSLDYRNDRGPSVRYI